MNILDIDLADLDTTGTVALRKLARELGIKGMSSARGADLREAITDLYEQAEQEIEDEELEEDEEELESESRVIEVEVEAVEAGTAMKLGEKSKVVGKSRAGMVIIAKGSEFHKSATFKAAAEAEGWDVTITVTLDEENVDEETGEPIEKHTAVATRDGDEITLVWNGKAYDYPASGAVLDGKARKVRNMKEGLRFL